MDLTTNTETNPRPANSLRQSQQLQQRTEPKYHMQAQIGNPLTSWESIRINQNSG